MGAPFASFKIYVGTTGSSIEYPLAAGIASSPNLNLMSSNTVDTSGTLYQTLLINIPASGSAYSYERWFRMRFDANPAYSLINNIKLWHESGGLSDAALSLFVAKTDATASFVTPQNIALMGYTGLTDMSIANTAGTNTNYVLDLTPTASIASSATGYSQYGIIQLRVPSTVTTFGDIGIQTMKVSYDVS